MSNSIRSVKNLVAVVTGGSGGIGKATAHHLLKQGAFVAIWDLPSTNGEKVSKELGNNCIFNPVDVTKESDVQDALKNVEDTFKKLDVAINCAGIIKGNKVFNFQRGAPHSFEAFNDVIGVNTVGTFNVIRLAVGLMAKNQPDEDGQKGVIINTASVAADEGQTGQVAYSASKGGVVGMTLPLARDLASEGIRCCTISPGLISTDMFMNLPQKVQENLYKQLVFPRRIGHPVEYAQLVQSIIENKMLNGCVIRLDGALRMH